MLIPLRPGRRGFVRLFLVFLVFVSLSVLYFFLKSRPPYKLYEELFITEADQSADLLKKHDSGGTLKFVKFRQLQGAGFNNQAQEILLFHHLALVTSRVYVYQPLVWRPRGQDAEIPLSAFLPGVTRATLSSAAFDKVCPEEEVSHVRLTSPHWSNRWQFLVDALESSDRCIMVDDWIFDWNYLASPGIWALWSGFKLYLKLNYVWSSSVLSIIERTRVKLGFNSTNPDETQSYIALHLRRGDFEEHCKYLASKKAGFTTWATLPILQSSVFPPAIVPSNASSVIEHCYPTISRILSAVSFQAKRHPEARKVLILHDGTWDHPFVYVDLYKIRSTLMSESWAAQQGWSNGPMTNVLTIDGLIGWYEHDWGVCVDVELARRATVFVGNGFSSLSTQIAALRLADEKNSEDITFF